MGVIAFGIDFRAPGRITCALTAMRGLPLLVTSLSTCQHVLRSSSENTYCRVLSEIQPLFIILLVGPT